MRNRIAAAAMTVLFVLLAFVAVMVTDFHDRAWPQALRAQAQVTLDFAQAPLDNDAARDLVASVGRAHHLGLLKRVPDLDDPSREVFVALAGQPASSVSWFGDQAPSVVVDAARLAHSPADGTYLVRDASDLAEAIADLSTHGVAVVRTDASVVDTVRHLLLEPGFAAPVAAAALLAGGLAVFWIASRARSRALRVLAGTSSWRVQAQDLGGFFAVLLGCTTVVAAGGCVLVGVLRGWVYVPAYATSLGLLGGVAGAAFAVVVPLVSMMAWPNPDLYAARRPPVAVLRGPAAVVQAVALLALLVCAGPAWSAAHDAADQSRQLATWNSFADQVALAFALGEGPLDVIAPDLARMTSVAERDGAAAMSYTFDAASWSGDFRPYSAISIVNPGWVDLVGHTLGPHALADADTPSTRQMVRRELGAQLDLLRRGSGTDGDDVFAALRLLTPAPGVSYPVLRGGTGGDLIFRSDVLVLVAPTISAAFDDTNLTSIATTANIVLTGVEPTQARLAAAGLSIDDLAARGIDGSITPLYMAEQGILRAQYATYRARSLTASLIVLAIAFLIAAGVNATISALIHARRDLPLRLAGATWEAVARPRALADLLVGALLAAVALAIRHADPGALAATAAAAIVGLSVLYASHGTARAAVFTRLTHRHL
ncbi:hypothetical protein [Xylanimonas protaetiae]|uniref:Uncharacterized protein n=1 Tax=Xylanimonas protaetiae TaxID=2509457 RepID=A0A4P6F145_9MICO|nr:hypothetical protein [Xylanimonas protaetiae]QAY69480.1 hypothetical protein ET471_05030 [Xylanimonas protaetiae]